MRIAIDLDSTISLFVEHWLNIANAIYDSDVKPNEILGWEIEKYYTHCTKDEIYNILNLKHFFKHVEPREDARAIIHNLKNHGHDVFIVTACYNIDSAPDKVWWLNKMMGIDINDTIFCIDKSRINADILIDDGLHNFDDFDGIKLLFDQPHNWSARDYEFDCRVKSWRDIEAYCKLNGIL